MRKLIIVAVITTAVFAFVYGIFSFVKMDAYPSSWDMQTRGILIAIWIYITGMCLWVFLQEYESKK